MLLFSDVGGTLYLAASRPNSDTRCSVKKKGRTLHICVGLFEVFPSLSRLVVDPVVDGRDGHAVVLWVENTRDPVYVLSEKKS